MTVVEFIFGKKEEPMTDEELEKYTQRRERELDSKTRITVALTKYDKARIEHKKVLGSNPIGNSGMAGLFAKKGTWFVIVGLIFLIVVIKVVA